MYRISINFYEPVCSNVLSIFVLDTHSRTILTSGGKNTCYGPICAYCLKV